MSALYFIHTLSTPTRPLSFGERAGILVSVHKLIIKIFSADFSLELKGPEQAVTDQFAEIKQHGLGQLSQYFSPTPPQSHTPENTTIKDDGGLSDVNQLLYKNLIKTEAEWVLMYGYFITRDLNQEYFSREQLLEYYKRTNRYTRNRSKSLTFNLRSCVRKNWLRVLNKTDFVITERGIEHVYQIINTSA